jgi:hypothetical protein
MQYRLIGIFYVNFKDYSVEFGGLDFYSVVLSHCDAIKIGGDFGSGIQLIEISLFCRKVCIQHGWVY